MPAPARAKEAPAQTKPVSLEERKPAEEQGIVTDVLAHFALVVKWTGFQHRVRLDEHLANFLQPFPAGVADSVQMIDMNEINQKAADVFRNTWVILEMARDHLAEEPP